MMEYVQFRIGFYQLIYFWVAAHTRTHTYIYIIIYNICCLSIELNMQ